MLVGLKDSLTYEIEQLVFDHNLSYMDAILFYCEKNNFDYEYIGSLVTKNEELKSKVAIEAESLNFLEKTDRLPI